MIQFSPTTFPAKPAVVRRCLLEAAVVVRTRGLAKYFRQDAKKRVCLHGALGIAACGDPYVSDKNPVYHRAVRVVCYVLRKRRESGVTPNGAARWNNAATRTAEEVAQLFETAARHLRQP